MWSFKRLVLAMGLVLVVGHLAAANQAESFLAGSVYLSNPSPCLGQTVTLYATIANTDYPTDGAGQIDIKAAMIGSADYPGCATSTTTVLADRWWVIYSDTTSSIPATPATDYNGIGQGGNGYQVSGLPSGNPTWGTETLAIPFTISNTVSALGTDYLMVYLKGNYVDPTSTTGFDDEICLPITVGSSGCSNPAPSGTVSARVAGTASNGNIMVYWLDYNFFNDTGLSITDAIPACETILAYSPSPTGAAATVAGNTITWAVPDASLSATPYPLESIGSVWVEVQVGSGCGYPLCDQAAFAGAGGLAGSSNSLCQANGQNVLLSKQQYDASFNQLSNGSSVTAGATVNYVLNYSISGAQLKCFDPFNYTVATSTPAANASPAWSSNWMADSQTGAQGASQWNIASINNDTCLQFVPASASDFRELYYTCGTAAAQVASCTNIDIVADVRLDDPANQGLDAGIWVQSDNASCPAGYMLVLSGDDSAGNAVGHMAIQRMIGTCGSGCCNWVGAAPNAVMYSQVWYTAEVLETSPGVIYAKFWQRGTPEPTGWMLSYTDSAPLACPGASNHIGVGGLGGQTEFDNFQVSTASSVSNASIWDTVPSGIGFQSSTPVATGQPAVGSSNSLVHWDFTGSNYGAVDGELLAGSGSFTWSGLAECPVTGQIANVAAIGGIVGASSTQAYSNIVTLGLACGTSTITPSVTGTPSLTALPGTATFTPTPTQTAGSSTATPTPTAAACNNLTDVAYLCLSSTSDVASHCPGDNFSLSLTFCNTNPYSTQPADFYVWLQEASLTGTAISEPLGTPGQWLLYGNGGAQMPPLAGGAWGASPLGGGYTDSFTAAYQCITNNLTLQLPAGLKIGTAYRLRIQYAENYAGQNAGVSSDIAFVSAGSGACGTATSTQTVTLSPTVSTTSTVTETASTTAGSVTASGTPTLTATPSGTGMPTFTSTHTETGTPTDTTTPTQTSTITDTFTPMPSGTRTDTPTSTSTVTDTFTPTTTAVQGSSTRTLTPAGATSAPTDVIIKTGIVKRVLCMPNLVRSSTSVDVFALCSGVVPNATLRLYSGSYTMVKQLSSGPMDIGWNRFSLPAGWFKGLPNGLYHLTLAADDQASPARTVVFVLR